MSDRPLPGEMDLGALRRELAPLLHPDTFVYCTFADFRIPTTVRPIFTFCEQEGLTVVLRKEEAIDLGCSYQFECRLVTLTVHSSLHAVGLLACVTGALAGEAIPCNAVAGFHHDHLFVPADQADHAMEVLRRIAHRALV